MIEMLIVVFAVWTIGFIADIGVTARNSKMQEAYAKELEENNALLEEQNDLLARIVLEEVPEEDEETAEGSNRSSDRKINEFVTVHEIFNRNTLQRNKT